jgi:hypothetical protein
MLVKNMLFSSVRTAVPGDCAQAFVSNDPAHFFAEALQQRQPSVTPVDMVTFNEKIA